MGGEGSTELPLGRRSNQPDTYIGLAFLIPGVGPAGGLRPRLPEGVYAQAKGPEAEFRSRPFQSDPRLS